MMLVHTIGQPWLTLDTELLAFGLFDGSSEALESCRGTAFGALLTSLIERKDAPVEVGATLMLHGVAAIQARSVVLFGLGKRDEFDAGVAFEAGVALCAAGRGERAEAPGRGDARCERPESQRRGVDRGVGGGHAGMRPAEEGARAGAVRGIDARDRTGNHRG